MCCMENLSSELKDSLLLARNWKIPRHLKRILESDCDWWQSLELHTASQPTTAKFMNEKLLRHPSDAPPFSDDSSFEWVSFPCTNMLSNKFVRLDGILFCHCLHGRRFLRGKYIVMKRFAICFKRENDWNVNESNKAVSVMLILLNSCRDWSEAFFSFFAFIAFSAYTRCDSDIDFRLLRWERAQHAATRWSVGEVWLHIMIKKYIQSIFCKLLFTLRIINSKLMMRSSSSIS